MSEIPHPEDGSAKRAGDRIFQAASNLFYRQGIHAVGVDEIVTRAGATKPSLYRRFESKDELVAAYIRERGDNFWALFDAAAEAHPGDPRAQLLAFFEGLEKRTAKRGHRGCGVTNALVEHPDPDHPGRLVAVAHKAKLRKRLRAMTAEMDAKRPNELADGLLLLIEGAYISSLMFEEDRPAEHVRGLAKALIKAYR